MDKKLSSQKLLILISLFLAVVFFVFFLFQKFKEIEFSSKEGGETKEGVGEFNPRMLSWQEATSNASWSGRDAHATIVFKDKIWLFGGVEGGSTEKSPLYGEIPHKSDLWVSENGTDWQRVSEKAGWGERRSAGVVVFKDKIWLMAGWTKKFGETKNDIWVSEDGINWEIITNSAPWSPREGHTVVVFQDKIWVMGGVDFFKKEEKVKNDVWFSDDGVHWKQITPQAPWSKRYDHTLTVFKDKLWLVGGYDFGGQVKKDIWVSEDGENWQLVSDNPPWLPRHGHIALEYKDNLWIIGGWSEGKGGLNDTWYSADGYNWQKTKLDGPWLGREDHSGVLFNDKIWIMGGMAEEGERWTWKNDVWRSASSL